MTYDPLLAGGEFHKHSYRCCNCNARVPSPSIARLNGEGRRRGNGREEEEEELGGGGGKEGGTQGGTAEVSGNKSIQSKTRVVYTDSMTIEDALVDFVRLEVDLDACGYLDVVHWKGRSE